MPEDINSEHLVDWEDLIADTKDQKATLVLGPEVILNGDNEKLYQQLIKNSDHGVLNFQSSTGIFLFQSEFHKSKAQRTAVNFYKENHPPNPFLKQILDLPFKLVLNSNPDSYLVDIYRENKRDCQFDFFTTKPIKKRNQISEASTNFPLIYNLFGHVEEHESIILDYEDMFEHLRCLLNHTNFPDEIQYILSKTTSFIFIGFKVDNWITQLLFRFLNMKKHAFDNSKKNYTARIISLDEKAEAFYKEQFNIKYIGGAVEFLELFHQKYTSLETLENGDSSNSTLEKSLKRYVVKGEIEKCVESLLSFLDGKNSKEMENEVLLLSAQYHQYKRQEKNQTQSQDFLRIHLNQIREGFFYIIDKTSSI